MIAGFVEAISNEWRRRLCRLRGIDASKSTYFHGAAIITRHPDSQIVIGDGVVLTSRSTRTALGVAHPVVMRTLARGAAIRIGKDCGLSGVTICAATGVEIGAGTLIGADAIIVDTDFHPIDSNHRRHASPPPPSETDIVRIGENVFIGARAIILKGTTIGNNTVIGAGAVVSGSIPPDCVAAGNPARVLRQLSSEPKQPEAVL